ncbi:MAG: glutathione peroxidase [Flavobacteriales bacterium]|jgi:glutathione peroxidase
MSQFYNLKVNSPSGKEIPMSEFRNKVVLIVNTATQCGLTPQFDGLESLHIKHKDTGLVVLGMPCNQFGNQEPVENDVMTDTCRINHGVSFQLTEKINVNGSHEHPVFSYLKNKKGGFFTKKIKWNFTKFLIDKSGMVVKRYSPTKKPKRIEKDILRFLKV